MTALQAPLVTPGDTAFACEAEIDDDIVLLPVKAAVMDAIARLPDDATLDDIHFAIEFRVALDRGLRDCQEGRVVSHDEVIKSMSRWLN